MLYRVLVGWLAFPYLKLHALARACACVFTLTMLCLSRARWPNIDLDRGRSLSFSLTHIHTLSPPLSPSLSLPLSLSRARVPSLSDTASSFLCTSCALVRMCASWIVDACRFRDCGYTSSTCPRSIPSTQLNRSRPYRCLQYRPHMARHRAQCTPNCKHSRCLCCSRPPS